MADQHSIPQRDIDRFWRGVEKTDTCWLWTKSVAARRYGQILAGGNRWRAHRLSWLLANGAIPDGMHVCHRCDNTLCVNPLHLFLGTHAENMRDKVHKNRHPHGSGHLNAKLSEADVVEILQLLRDGETLRAIGRRFAVSNVTILRIKRGEWAHVPR